MNYRKQSYLAGLFTLVLAVGLGMPSAGAKEAPEDLYSRIYQSLEGKESTPSPTETPAYSSEEPSAAKDDEYVQIVRTIHRDVERLWGRQTGRQIDPVVLDKEGLKELLNTLLDQELSDPNVQGAEHLMKFLGMIPEDAPLRDIYQALLEGQVGGLYDPTSQKLYVVNTFDPQGFLGRIILSHEICHAVQDSAVGLKEYFEEEPNLDRQKAKQCLIEGDATMLMMEWAQENLNWFALLADLSTALGEQTQGINEAPQALVQDMIFSYVGGAEFCAQALVQWGNGWRQELFENPPQSTEQVLHPEKFFTDNPDQPQEVKLAAASEASLWREVFRNTLGEWQTRLILTPLDKFPKITMLNFDPMIKDQAAIKGAAGWGGDIAALFLNDDGQQVLVWRSVWDSEQDAKEFMWAVQRRVNTMDTVTNPSWENGVLTSEGRKAELRLNGETVDFVMGTSEEAMDFGRDLIAREVE